MVVEQGQTFVFGVLPRRHDEQSRADCEQVRAWLEAALCWTGAGAKTAVGYGRFTPDGNAQQVHQQAAEERAKRDEERRQRELARTTADKSELYSTLYITSPNEHW